MEVGILGRDPATRRAHHETLLDQVRLEHVLDRAAFLADRGRKALDTDGPSVELLDNRL